MRTFSLAALAASLLSVVSASPPLVKRGSGRMFGNPAFVPPPTLASRAPTGNATMFGNPASLPPPHIERGLQTRATPSPPYFVVYSDAWINGQTGPAAPSSINVSAAGVRDLKRELTNVRLQGFNVMSVKNAPRLNESSDQ